jgi:hypothetical protein
MAIYTQEIKILQKELLKLPKHWDGQSCILELKDANYNWRQMEWWAFYFEYKVKSLLPDKFTFPGDKFDNVTFDLKGKINWDLKAKFLNSDSGFVYLNDKKSVDKIIEKDSYYGITIALLRYDYKNNNCDVKKIAFLVINNETINRLNILEDHSKNIEQYIFDLDKAKILENGNFTARLE